MKPLTIPSYPVKERMQDAHRQLFDGARRRWVAYTPEEYVRQQFIAYLIAVCEVPIGVIGVEHPFVFENGKPQRADLIVFGSTGSPLLLVECKAPSVKLTASVFEQASRYNAVLRAPRIVLTNGVDHYAFHTTDRIHYTIETVIPSFDQMVREETIRKK